VPVIAVARAKYDRGGLIERMHASLIEGGGVDEAAFERLAGRLQLVNGDYEDEQTFVSLRKALGGAERPLLYLAIPPSLFATVATGLARSGCARGARRVVEKPFGRDLASAQELNGTLHEYFPESAIFRIDHFLGKEPVQNLVYFHLANLRVDASFRHSAIDNVQVTMAERFGVEGRGKFYEEVGAIRDVVENHMLQLIACLAMECPPNSSYEALRDEKARVIKAMRSLRPEDVVRGQFRGYRDDANVARDSTVETYAALRLAIDNDRWAGVPFYVRVGKKLPVTVTEVFIQYKRPLWAEVMAEPSCAGDYLRLRISPDVVIAEGTRVKKPGVALRGDDIELLAAYAPAGGMLAYERLFHDALAGDVELFAREDMIEAQWRVVDGILGDVTPVHEYDPETWGPEAADRLLAPGTRWHDPLAPHGARPPARAVGHPEIHGVGRVGSAGGGRDLHA
jgi:glucose-6-phosphate 1-dehydrogenase